VTPARRTRAAEPAPGADRIRLITLAGAFEHIVYGPEDNACIEDTVGAYLLNGTLPATDVTCHRAGSAPRPDTTRRWVRRLRN